MNATLFRKEFLEHLRTAKLLVLGIVLLVMGLISPMLAKYTPVLLRSIPDVPAAIAEMIPDPTLVDAVGQYTKNITQFGILLVIILNMGAVAQEKERGTLAMLLNKPVRRSGVVLSKWLTSLILLAACLLLAAAACLLYTAILFELLPVGKFLFLNLLVFLYLSVFLSVTLLGSTLARNQSQAAIFGFGGLILLLLLGAIPRVNDYAPAQMVKWGETALLNQPDPQWGALIVSLLLIFSSVAAACLVLEKQEI